VVDLGRGAAEGVCGHADLLEVVEHAHLRLGPLHVNGLLGDAPVRHLRLDVLEAELVVADVVGHVAVRVDGEQLGLVLDEDLADVEVGAGGGRVQWRPQVVVAHVHVRAVLDQQLEQVRAVVDATLKISAINFKLQIPF